MSVEIGLLLWHALSRSPRTMADMAQAAEAAGYSSVWVSEHMVIPVDYESQYPYGTAKLTYESQWNEAMVAMGFLAGVTSTVNLGTAVLPMWTRHPIVLAKQAATVDLLSGGRFQLGVGAGWLREEALALGAGVDRRGDRLEEAIDIMKRAWTEPSVESSGEFWRFPPVGVRPQPAGGAGLPIWIGGHGPRAIRTANERGIGMIVPPGPTARTRQVRDALQPGRRVASTLAGLDRGDAALDDARAMVDAGCDLVLVMPDGDPVVARRQIDWFAGEVVPRLG